MTTLFDSEAMSVLADKSYAPHPDIPIDGLIQLKSASETVSTHFCVSRCCDTTRARDVALTYE